MKESFLPCEFSFVSAQLLQHPVPGVYVLPSDASALSELLLLLFIIVMFMLKPECCLSLSSPKVWYGLLCVRGGIYRGAMFKFTLLIPANYPEGGCPVSVQYVSRLSVRKLFKRGRGDKSLRFSGNILCFVCQLNNGSWEHVAPGKCSF